MRGKTSWRLATFALLASLAGCQKREPPTESLATVNGQPVTAALVDAYARSRTGRTLDQLSEPDRKTLLRDVVRITVAAQAASGEGIDGDPQVAADIELQRLELLSKRLVARHTAGEPTDAEVRAEYEAQAAAAPALDWRVRHILVPTEDAANAALAELRHGADFAKLAATVSQDTSRTQGGDLGWVDTGRLPDPLATAIRTLKSGDLFPTPVHTDYGWHVVEVTETRAAASPPLESVRPQIVVTLRERHEREFLDGLLASAKVEEPPATTTKTGRHE